MLESSLLLFLEPSFLLYDNSKQLLLLLLRRKKEPDWKNTYTRKKKSKIVRSLRRNNS